MRTMSQDPYLNKNIDLKKAYKKKQKVKGRLVALMDLELQNRNLKLIEPPSRAVKKGDIHELVITDEDPFKNNMTVEKAIYIGFIEIHQGGIILRDDTITANGIKIGNLVGFDRTHMPNHLNVVAHRSNPKTVYEFGFEIGDEVIINKK